MFHRYLLPRYATSHRTGSLLLGLLDPTAHHYFHPKIEFLITFLLELDLLGLAV